MTTTECATDISVPASQTEPCHTQSFLGSPEASKSLKGLLLSFGITVTIGLMLASWYLGVRIVATDPVVAVNPTPVRPTPVGHVNSAPSVQSSRQLDAKAVASCCVAPRNHFYLQAAGIGPKQDANFVRSLHAKGFHAQVQPGESGNARILIGPFSTDAEMQQVQRKLQSAGVLAVETAN